MTDVLPLVETNRPLLVLLPWTELFGDVAGVDPPGCHILCGQELAEHTVIALAVPVNQVSVMNAVLVTVFAHYPYRRMFVMHVEGLDSHLQQHHHQQRDGI